MKTDAAKCWATIGTADPVCENNYDSRAVCRIKKWLNQCKESHQLCRGGEGMFMPRRALDLGLEGIGDPGDPVLVDTDKQYPYVALSYCWGSAKEKWVLTKKINIEQHRQSLPFSQLPATLRDAINLTKKLGFRFIWVDALCIIQDDYMDWVTEAATMGDVYYNASLVLAANTSGDCTLGLNQEHLFGSRAWQRSFVPFHWAEGLNYVGPLDPEPSKSAVRSPRLSIKLSWPPQKGVVCVRLSRWIGHTQLANSSLIPPLDSRGWTFQETILARRVVRFSITEMAWHCAELERCECSFSDLGFDKAEIKSTSVPPLIQQYRTLHQVWRSTLAHERIASADDLYQVWKMLVQNYSTRYLTLREDKLIAISGVARRIEDALANCYGIQEKAYVAGVWKADLMESLLWAAQSRPGVDDGSLERNLLEVEDESKVNAVRKAIRAETRPGWVPDVPRGWEGWLAKQRRQWSLSLIRSTILPSKVSEFVRWWLGVSLHCEMIPSWSWASIDSSIKFLRPPALSDSRPIRFIPAVEIGSVVADEVTIGTGTIKTNVLTLRGRIIPVEVRSVIIKPLDLFNPTAKLQPATLIHNLLHNWDRIRMLQRSTAPSRSQYFIRTSGYRYYTFSPDKAEMYGSSTELDPLFEPPNPDAIPTEPKPWPCFSSGDNRLCGKQSCQCCAGWTKPAWALEMGKYRWETSDGKTMLCPVWLILEYLTNVPGACRRVGVAYWHLLGRETMGLDPFRQADTRIISLW